MRAIQATRSASMRASRLPRLRHVHWAARPFVLAWRSLCAAVLVYQIWETENYLADCEREGLTGSLSLAEFRGDLQRMRVRLIDLTTRS